MEIACVLIALFGLFWTAVLAFRLLLVVAMLLGHLAVGLAAIAIPILYAVKGATLDLAQFSRQTAARGATWLRSFFQPALIRQRLQDVEDQYLRDVGLASPEVMASPTPDWLTESADPVVQGSTMARASTRALAGILAQTEPQTDAQTDAQESGDSTPRLASTGTPFASWLPWLGSTIIAVLFFFALTAYLTLNRCLDGQDSACETVASVLDDPYELQALRGPSSLESVSLANRGRWLLAAALQQRSPDWHDESWSLLEDACLADDPEACMVAATLQTEEAHTLLPPWDAIRLSSEDEPTERGLPEACEDGDVKACMLVEAGVAIQRPDEQPRGLSTAISKRERRARLLFHAACHLGQSRGCAKLTTRITSQTAFSWRLEDHDFLKEACLQKHGPACRAWGLAGADGHLDIDAMEWRSHLSRACEHGERGVCKKVGHAWLDRQHGLPFTKASRDAHGRACKNGESNSSCLKAAELAQKKGFKSYSLQLASVYLGCACENGHTESCSEGHEADSRPIHEDGSYCARIPM